MRIYKLNNTTLKIKGNATAFLNGITSNALDAPLNAFLNQHGRIIATFRQKKITEDEFLISVPSMAVDNLLKHLDRYAKISRVSLAPDSHKAYLDLDTRSTFWTTEDFPDSISDEAFILFRLDHSIPMMGVDYQADEFILNVHEFDYVSYTKGCFLGQEPVAKVHNRAHPSRKLIVQFEDECAPEDKLRMTSIITAPLTKRRKGFIFVSNKAS